MFADIYQAPSLKNVKIVFCNLGTSPPLKGQWLYDSNSL